MLDLALTERHRYRPFHVVAPAFVQELRPRSGDVDGLVRSDRSPEAPFAAVEIDVERAGGVLVAGLSAGPGADGDPGDHVLATYDVSRRVAAIEVRTAGRTRVLRRVRAALPGTFTFGFAVCENQVTVLVRHTAEGSWRPLVTERTKLLARTDLRRPRTLGRLGYTWGTRGGAATLGEVRAGLFGMTGLRDPHVVQHADGRPVVRDGKAYLTWTCAGLGFFAQAHWGVFSVDLAHPDRLEQVAQLFTRRDGLVLGDHAGQLVRDGDRWLVATSSWGDFDGRGVHVRHVTTGDDLLSGVHLLDTEPTALPTDVGAWDPGLTRVDGRWLLSFVESPSQRPFSFHPALAVTSASAPWTGLTRLAAADHLRQCEGPVLVQADGRWWVVASDADAGEYPVFDLAMRRAGRLDAPYLSNIPHPQLLRRHDGVWLMLTFDGTPYAEQTLGYGGHGDVVVLSDE